MTKPIIKLPSSLTIVYYSSKRPYLHIKKIAINTEQAKLLSCHRKQVEVYSNRTVKRSIKAVTFVL